MASIAVEWLMSRHDRVWHAFPTDQVGGAAFLAALCEHSVPVTRVAFTPPTSVGALCPPCVISLGVDVPDGGYRGGGR